MVAVGLLLALAASALLVAQRRAAHRASLPAQASIPLAAPPVPRDVAPLPTAVAPAVSAPPLAPASSKPKTPARTTVEAVPLTVTLDSTREGRHVRVGEDVTLTALAHGRSETLTLFYRRGRGGKTMLSFVEGSLSSTTWTPAVPGRYEFTATALSDRHQAAASRPIKIIVDGPAPMGVAPALTAEAAPRVAAVRPPSRPAHRPSKRQPPRAVPPPVARSKPHAPTLTYHVAAAQFPFIRNATVLADALNQRGYQAVPERMADRRGKTVYVVVTGTYRSPKEAHAAALVLQRNGYPAYFFGSR